MSEQPTPTAEHSKDFQLGFHAALKAALNGIGALAQGRRDGIVLASYAECIELVSGLQP